MNEWQTELLLSIEAGKIITDSDVEDFENNHGLENGEAFQYIAEYNSTGTQCEGCKYVQLHPHMYPCNNCSRSAKDFYERRAESES